MENNKRPFLLFFNFAPLHLPPLMRYVVLFLLLFCSFFSARAQSFVGTDNQLTYQPYGKCENQWVALSNRDRAGRYVYGYIFVNDTVGFMFYAEGLFRVDQSQNYVVDTVAFKGEHPKVAIPADWQNVATIASKHYAELHVPVVPDWVAPYYNYTDTAVYDQHIGFIYNDLGDHVTALPYLRKVWRLNNHTSKVAFELGWALNALGKYDEAIAVLTPAVKYDPNNPLLNKQLADACRYKKDYKKAILYYRQTITHIFNEPNETKSEAAFYLADIYKKTGNTAEYKNWMTKAKTYTPYDSQFYKAITDAGF